MYGNSKHLMTDIEIKIIYQDQKQFARLPCNAVFYFLTDRLVLFKIYNIIYIFNLK